MTSLQLDPRDQMRLLRQLVQTSPRKLPVVGAPPLEGADVEGADVEGAEAQTPAQTPSYVRLWVWTAVSGTALLLLLFGGYELVERTMLDGASAELIYALHIARGMGAAVVLGSWAFWVATRTRRHYDRRLIACIDELEEQVEQRSRELESSRAFTEHVFDTLRDRIVVTDADGRVVKANLVARDSVPAGCDQDCLVAEECGQPCRFDDAISTGTIRHDPETGRIFELDIYPMATRDHGAGLVLEVARDITEAKRLEALVVHQERMASLGVLAAGIAHDIGNPLASLSSELELLELDPEPDTMRESVGVLREHVDRIGRALREMVDFARRRGDEVRSDVDVGIAIADALRLIRHDPRTRKVKLIADVPSALPPVRMVEDHLVLVLVNLALNALDAMSDRGTLKISAAVVGHRVQISVRDDGAGMPREVAERAFEPMYTTKAGGGGTGLGLAVSRSVIRAAEGEMEIESALGRGTEVRISLEARGHDE